MQKYKLRLLIFISLLFFSITSQAAFFSSFSSVSVPSTYKDKFNALISQARNLNPTVLKLALTAYEKAYKRGISQQPILTVIDYTKKNTEKRLWVLDLKNNKVMYNTLVAHGSNSGQAYAKSFSNNPGSKQTSLGLYLTGNTYYGSNGYSLRLKGLDAGFNDNALKRAIVMHGAWYVNEDLAKHNARVGRSWGCPSLSPKVAKPIINTIKNGTLLFAYGRDSRWLKYSSFL